MSPFEDRLWMYLADERGQGSPHLTRPRGVF